MADCERDARFLEQGRNVCLTHGHHPVGRDGLCYAGRKIVESAGRKVSA